MKISSGFTPNPCSLPHLTHISARPAGSAGVQGLEIKEGVSGLEAWKRGMAGEERHGLEAWAWQLGMGLRHGLEDGLGLRHGLEAWGREGWLGLSNGKNGYSVRLENKSQKN